jgi:hypothetical protein
MALSGKERGVKERIKRTRHSADDADVIAMVIMTQNEATNQVFYQDKNKDNKPDNRWGKLRHKVSTVELGRKTIRDRMSPTAHKALSFTEEALKK